MTSKEQLEIWAEYDRLDKLPYEERLQGCKKLYEQQYEKVPKTVPCKICKKEVPTVDGLDEDGEYHWTIGYCTEGCDEVLVERQENRFIGTSEQYNKMVRKFAKLDKEQRHTLYRTFSQATDLDHITWDQWDTDAWDCDGWADSCWEASDETELDYYRHDFIHWLVFDFNGEQTWKNIMKEESK